MNCNKIALTQREVAQKLGIAQPSYIRYENGKAEPTIENLIKLADLFDVSIDFLCGSKNSDEMFRLRST